MQETKGHILKVLGGAQSGVEVAMGPGEYVLGAGQEDDLQFVDVSLSPGHVRLKIEDDTIFLAGGSGNATTAAGIEIATGDEDWRQIEDFDLITIGTTSFALGPRDGDWSKVATLRDPAPQTALRADNRAAAPRNAEPDRRTNRLVWVGAVALCALLGGAVFLAPVFSRGLPADTVEQRPGLEVLQEAFASVPFSHTVALRQEVDGVIFANGYVNAPVERRALINAVEKTGIPVRVRVFVLDSIRQQIAGMIERQKLSVSFTLSDTGAVAVSGDILDPQEARRFVSRLETDISGISQIDNQIQTADTYLDAVRQLAIRSELHEQVLFRLDGPLIEASGIIGSDKIDNYVGFIQSYARRFADHIPLRSLVQLVNESGQVIAMASGAEGGANVIGAAQVGQGLDLNRLKQGSFNANYVFTRVEDDEPVTEEIVVEDQTTPAATTIPTPDPETASPSPTVSAAQSIGIQDAARRLANVASNLLAGGSGGIANGVFDTSNGTRDGDGDPANPASNGDAFSDFNIAGLQDIVPDLQFRWRTRSETSEDAAGFLPLVVSPSTVSERCWRNSELTLSNLPLVLFWLDLLSLSETLDVTKLDVQSQHLLLEAALSPDSTAACAQRITRPGGPQLNDVSLFLSEIQRNPDFIRFIMRNVQDFQLPISGVMTGNGPRYVQVTNGLRLAEGASPDPSSKLASVGELGTLIRTPDSMSAVIYGETLAWKSKS